MLEIIELGEQLGFDSAWVRRRHLQYGISSSAAFWRPRRRAGDVVPIDHRGDVYR